MTDYFQDRIKLNPKLDIDTVPGPGTGRQTGSIDSKRSGDFAESSVIDSMGKTRKAPKNEPPDWSA